LGIIGENFSDDREVNGVVISLRKGRNRIGLWTRGDHQKVAMRVGTEWKRMLGLPAGIKIGYQSHSQAMKKNSHEITNQYTI
jgi:translation initiation factor 4E